MRRTVEKVFEWAAVLFGLLLVGSCSVSGFSAGKGHIATGVMMMCASAFIALIIVSWVFLVTRTSRDVRLLREQLAERHGDPPAPHPGSS